MSELVTLGKKACGICGRKDCNNPGWPSWGCMECYRIGYEREKARADEAETERRKTALFYNCGGEPPCEKCVTCQWDEAREALAAARREVALCRGVIDNLLSVMEMQEKRETEVFHISGEVMFGVWSDAKAQARAALAAPADGEEKSNG